MRAAPLHIAEADNAGCHRAGHVRARAELREAQRVRERRCLESARCSISCRATRRATRVVGRR